MIDIDNQVDPKDIDYGFTPIEILPAASQSNPYDEEQVYRSFDILSRLYGYDFEDYNYGGFNPTETMAVDMPDFFDDETLDKSGKVRVQFKLDNGEASYVHDIQDFWKYVVVGNIDDNMNPEGSLESGEENEIDYTIYSIQFMMIDSEDFESDWTEPWLLKVTNEGPDIIDTPEEPDWFRVIQTGDSVEFTKWFDIEDDEDYTYARQPYNFIDPDFDENLGQWTINIYDDNTSNLIWQTGDTEPLIPICLVSTV